MSDQQKLNAIIKILMQHTMPIDQMGFTTVEQIARKILEITKS